MRPSRRLFILLGGFALLVLFFVIRQHPAGMVSEPAKAAPPVRNAGQPARDEVRDQQLALVPEFPPEIPTSQASSTKPQKAPSVFERFNGWTVRYVAATVEQRQGLMDEGIKLARERRVELRQLIESDPRRAIENAVPPVLRQQFPISLVKLLEERVNEKGFYGVLGAVPSAENAKTPPYRREVRTSDGGRYQAFVYGRRLSQHSTENASIVGIAVDDAMAIDERPLRVVASGEIPNHPNNLARSRTVTLTDEQGFSGGRELQTTPAPPHVVVETCPISGLVTAKNEDSAAVTETEIVVEAGGQFHYLCRGGHIEAFEDQLTSREGGNGGPVMPTSPPTATQSTGYKTNLLMRAAFPEALKGSVTEKDGHDLGKNVQDWFVNSSYGAMTFMTTVTPLLVLPRSEAWYKDQDTTGSAYEVLADARAAAKAAGFDPANFNFDTVIFAGTPGSFGGQAYVGGKGCWLKSGTGTGVAAHEYGHNFGLMHANFWSTTNGSAIGGGSHVEYGDSFDTMGSASAGDYQYNACHKNILNWIPTALVHDVTTSGTYRIYQMDQPAQNPRLRYAIKTRKDADRDYWIDFRQLFTTNAWVQGGVFVHWSPWATSASGSHLLDTTPGSIDGKTDATVVIGRTFSDPETGIHITPIAKNSTTPPSADVVVNLGMFPGNQAPVVAVGTSATSVAANAAVNFTATASDADGDVLSYAWDFGDKSFSTTNSPAVSKSWATVGEYRVRCTVSDMKGKTASASVIITVGSPTTFRISGTITAGGLPLADVRVQNSLTGTSYREAITDSNGTYALVGLAAGTYTVATQLYGYTLTPAGSASVTVGPSKSNVNFTAADQPQVSIALQDADCSEGANTGTFRFSRTGSTAAALTVLIYTPSGSATKNTDYTQVPSFPYVAPFDTITIPAGSSFSDVIVTAADDTAVESYESYTLELAPSTNYVLGNAAATLWIGDTDTANSLVRLRVTDRDVDESGDGGQFSIERLGATTAALNVSVALSGTATNGTDYASIPTTITIPAGSSSVPVNVTPLQDSAVETMETVILTINVNAAYTRPAASADYSATVNLHDDDQPILTVVATDSAAAEAGNDPGIFTITRTGSTASALTVNYGLTGSALHGTDYVPLPGVLTIPAGSAVATVVITPIDDAIGEPAQTAVFQLRGGIGYTVGAASNATVTITDNSDVPYASIAVTTGPAIEGGTAGVFRITTTGTGTGNINVLYTVTGTATNGTDYTTLSGTVSIAKNATSNLSVATLQDSLIEGYETVTVTLTPDPAYSLALDSSATMNLQDDDAPQVNVSTTDDAFTEANGSLAKFFVSRTGATTNALTVNYTLGGTATSGVDYTAPSGSVTISAAATGTFVNISMFADTLAEGTETLVLNVSPDAAYATGIGSATRYIVDSQSASVVTQVRFSAATSSAAESAGTVIIPVTLSAAAAAPVTVEYFINGGTALAAGIDYALTAGVLTFAPGETSKNIVVTLNDDTNDENNETLVVALTNPNNAKLGTSSHTLTITDSDTPPGVTVGFAGTAGSGLESQSPAPLTVALGKAQASTVTLDYAVTGGTATGGGTDYAITAGTLTFAAGETVKVIPNTIIDDASVDAGETIILTLSNPVGAVLSANTVFTYTITDDDAATVTIVATDASAAEPGTDTGLFTVTRTGPTTAALTVNFSVTGTATSGSDYANLANTVVIAAGASSATVLVTPLNNTTIEPAETVVLTLTPGVYTIGAANSATVTIADDDVDMVVTLVASDATAAESGDPGAFTLTRAGSTLDSLTVNLGVTGTATAGSDYTALATSVVIPAAATSVVIPVSPLTDSLNEGDETVILTALAGSGYTRGTPASATVIIANTDDGSPPTLAPGSIVDNKGGGPVFIDTLVTYTVTFSKDMDASTVTAADFGNAGSATVTIGAVTETTPTSGVFTVQATPTNAGTLQLKVNAAAVLNSVAGTNLDTTSAIADNTVITVAGYAPTLADALDTSGLTWTNSGNANWFYQTSVTHDGTDAAQSGVIGNSQTSAMETTVTGPGSLTFWWKVSSESGFDYLLFYLDGVEQTGSLAKISGLVDWTQKTVTIPAGNHTVKWGYTKNAGTVANADAAWVDQVVYTPDFAPEIAVEQPVGNDLVDGGASIDCGPVNLSDSSSPFTFTVRNTGALDLTGLSLTKDGSHNADFTLGSLGATTLAPGASTTFTVTFTPGAAGGRNAAIHLASNDADENPFDIALTGTGVPVGTLAVTPAGDFSSSGGYGGSFSPASQEYTLSNIGSTPIDWTATKTAPWVNLSATGGTLAAGASTLVTASINDNANTLAVAGYSDTVTFVNATNNNGDTMRGVSLTVTPGSAIVTLGDLSHAYDGSAKSASVTTDPPDLDYSVTYAGDANPPSNAGTYSVVATITDPNYGGSASGNLVIAKGSQTINFAALDPVPDNQGSLVLTATATSGLTVSYGSSNPAVATISGGTVNIVGLGTTTLTASQAGDGNYNAATSVQQTLTVVRANPLAVSGGPYKVILNQPLSLNGVGSQPSFGETITTYSWDLNNDNNFADATGSTPSISYANLTSPAVWNMVEGLNPIQLRVTDSAGKTSTVSTTVEIVIGLTWDANTSTGGVQDGAGAWIGGNWWDGGGNQTWSSGSSANFGNGGAGGAVTLASATSINNLVFNSFTGTYTLGSATQAITLNGGVTKNSGSAAATMISPITLGAAQTWTNNSTGLLTASAILTNGGYLLTVDGTGNTTSSGGLTGAGGLQKNGSGTLVLAGTNNYTGGTVISAGQITVTGAATLQGLVTGTGVLVHTDNTVLTLSNTGNTFSGPITAGGGTTNSVTVSSLGDASGAGLINLGTTTTQGGFTWAGSSGATKTFTNRQFTLSGTTGGGAITASGATAADNLVISQNLLVTGVGTKTFTLGGANIGANTFAGNIANGTGSVINLTKSGTGNWAVSGNLSHTGGLTLAGGASGNLSLSGTNTYSGATTVGTGTSTAQNVLVIQGLQALSPNTTVTLTQNSTPSSFLRLLDDAGGTTTLPNTVTISHANTVQAIGIFVGNNNTANGGTSSGTTTGSTIALSKLNFSTTVAAQPNVGFNAYGANGYRLQLNKIDLPAVTVAMATWNAKVIASGPVTIAGPVQQLSGTTGASNTVLTLTLDGTNTANLVSGDIKNPVDYPANTLTRPLAIAKNGTSVWTLSGNNTFSGGLTLSGASTGSQLNINSATVLGTGTFTISGGNNAKFDNTSGLPLTLGTNNAQTWSNDFVFVGSSDLNLGTGAVAMGGTRIVTVTANTLTVGGAISGSGFNLTKSGSGNLVLGGASSYTGTTTVSAGKLFINGDQTAATGAVSVSANATLGGTGIIGGATTIAASGKLEFNLSTAAASHDKLDLAATKSLTFSGASTLTITSSGGATTGTYTLVTAPGGIVGSVPATLNLPAGWIATVAKVGNDLVLNLTVPDTTPPTLADITDDKGGSPITANTLVTYTVTFSEDMDATTVANTVFGNAGTAAVTIGSVAETTPGVFTVQATPTTAGTLRLKVNAGAVLKDAAGNALDTTAAIPDDTTLTVSGNPPTLTSIVDDKSGGPVAVNTLVTYTVTFSKDMDAVTVTSADFSNAGSAAVSIGSVTETTPGVFAVQATPTTAGILQLRVNQSAELKDLAGNTLDTTSAIDDDTSITVRTVFDAWADGTFSNGVLGNKNVAFDFDGGGLATGIEWVVGGDPTTGSDDAAKAPTCDVITDPAYLTYTYRRSDAANTDANTAIKVQYCADLGNWTNAVAGPDVIINEYDNFYGSSPGIDKVEVRIKLTPALGNRVFARLNVVIAP